MSDGAAAEQSALQQPHPQLAQAAPPAAGAPAAPQPANTNPFEGPPQPAPRVDQSAVNAYDRLLQEKEQVIRE